MNDTRKRMKVLCPLSRGAKTFWMRVGTAFVNADGSISLYLDAYPTDRKLVLRDLDARDEVTEAQS